MAASSKKVPSVHKTLVTMVPLPPCDRIRSSSLQHSPSKSWHSLDVCPLLPLPSHPYPPPRSPQPASRRPLPASSQPARPAFREPATPLYLEGTVRRDYLHTVELITGRSFHLHTVGLVTGRSFHQNPPTHG